MPQASDAGRVFTARPASVSPWVVAAVGIATLVAVPVAAVLSSLTSPAVEIWVHLWRTQLVELTWNTARLLAGVGAGTLVLGTALAWLVVHHRFPGRAALEWALVLPLAMPAYVIGFASLGLFDFAGPVQTALRRAFGESLRLPEIRSYGGVTLMMVLVYYPYVYLLARAAFRAQGGATLETARSLGRSRLVAFLRVTLPLARPSLVAGAALAMMEALADFGTVATFGYRTYTEAIYRVWYGMFERIAATQLASVLLLFAFALILLERSSRGRQRFTQGIRRGPATMPLPLTGWRAWTATAACAAVLTLAFLLPVGQLAWWGIEAVREGRVSRDFPVLLANTLSLATLAAGAACVLAVVLAYAGRLHPTRAVQIAGQFASMGYALPGSVIAVGVLLPLAWLDHGAGALLERVLGRPVGLLLTGSAIGLVGAYVVRFLAVSLQTVDASLTRISPILDDAARSLGAGAGGVLRRVHVPMIRGGLATALILVFVETMKEMPATLLLRPFGFNTLSVEVWERTSEALWHEAAIPALAIVGAGLLPVILAIRWSTRDTRGR
jgi:iron(III) transport system permease protein